MPLKDAHPGRVRDASVTRLIPIERVAVTKIRWLWRGRIPSRRVTVIAGADKVGKTLVLCKIAATVANGKKWPFREGKAKHGRVVLISPEDNTADTLRPRLEAAGAVLNRTIFVLPIGSTFDFETGLDGLAERIKKIGRVRLVAFDPGTALLGSIHRGSGDAIRALFARLGAFAEKLHVAVIVTAHLNKTKSVAGSFEWLAASRAAFLVARRGSAEERIFVGRPSTLSKEMPAISFNIRERKLPRGMRAPAVRWIEPIELPFDEALTASVTKKSPISRSPVEQFILDELGRGPKKQNEIVELGKGKGFTEKMLRTACKSLSVVTERKGGIGPKGWWQWRLPSKPTQ